MDVKKSLSVGLDVDIELLEQKLTRIENQLDRILTKLAMITESEGTWIT